MTDRHPGEPLTKSSQQLIREAEARVQTVGQDEAEGMLNDPDVLFVDIRDPRELERTGMIPGAFHAPRGMLEFWVDPESPYYKPALDTGQKLVLYCGSGWRSALSAATLQDMGLPNVSHLEGGFTAWSEGGRQVVPYERRSKK
ncbi:rhodanese-like domain-containing protein [Nigerium massiliense]|uniref:rhodanese-like domain-containing protein n=1 Tax=Nigerium massiliense TaxID=1522317 RepID=UPI00058BFA0E|nr:rhodanese-like domain-containing protein [Nigerium massiliense]